MNQCTFSVGSFDKDGDCTDTAIFLHFGDFRMRVGTYRELISLRDNINRIIDEVELEYADYVEKKHSKSVES